jgi:lysyl-tRNA synthetase class 2
VKVSKPNVAERFELFYNGLELANGFSELCDSSQQRSRFESDNNRRLAAGLEPYPIDELLLSALNSGLPECAGVAIGLDRLLMVLLGEGSIDQVLSFVD